MNLNPTLAFNNAMEDNKRLQNDLIIYKTLYMQLQEENSELKNKIKEIEDKTVALENEDKKNK